MGIAAWARGLLLLPRGDMTASLSVARRARGAAAAVLSAAPPADPSLGMWRELFAGPSSSSSEEGQSMPGTRILGGQKWNNVNKKWNNIDKN